MFVIQSVEMITVPVLASAFPQQQAWWTLLGEFVVWPCVITCCERHQSHVFVVASVVTMMLGVQASILQPNLAAFAAEVSSSLYKVLMIAQACSAVCVCAVRVTTKSLLADTPETDGLAFFLAIAGLQLACGAAFVWLTHRPYIQRKLVIDRADSVDTDSTAGFTIRSDSGSSDFGRSPWQLHTVELGASPRVPPVLYLAFQPRQTYTTRRLPWRSCFGQCGARRVPYSCH